MNNMHLFQKVDIIYSNRDKIEFILQNNNLNQYKLVVDTEVLVDCGDFLEIYVIDFKGVSESSKNKITKVLNSLIKNTKFKIISPKESVTCCLYLSTLFENYKIEDTIKKYE